MAHRCRVLQTPDGSLRIIHPAPKARRPGESDEDFEARVFAATVAKHPDLRELPFVDLQEGELPADRVKRQAWRVKAGKVVVDPSIPDPPHPRKALLDEIDGAQTLDQLKAALRKALR